MSLYNAPVAKRTRRQMEIQWQQLLGRAPRNQNRKRNIQPESSESDLGQEGDEVIKNTASKTPTQNEFAGPSSPHKLSDESSFDKSEDEESYNEGSRNQTQKETRFAESDQGPEVVKNTASKTTKPQNAPSSAYKLIDESSIDESGEEESDTDESSAFSPEESDGVGETDSPELEDTQVKRKVYGSTDRVKKEPHTDSVYSSDDSDSDDDVIVFDKQEGADEDFEISREYIGGCQNNTKADSVQSTEVDEDEVFSTSESEGDRLELDYSNFPVPKRKQSPTKNIKEKNHSLHKPKMKKIDEISRDESSDDSYIPLLKRKQSHVENIKKKVLSASVDKHAKKDSVNKKRMKKMDLKPMDESSDDGGSSGAVLDTILNNDDINGVKADEIPLRFRFEDSDDETLIQEDEESNGTELFEEMDNMLRCEEIGSDNTPTAEKRQKDDCVDSVELCRKGEHGDTYFEEQIGLRCRLCGAVLLESKYVIPKLANYSLNKSRRSYRLDERQVSTRGSMSFEDSDWNPVDICTQVKGTVWQLVPISIRGHLYPHQQEAFQFLWENLAGTIEVSELQKLVPRGGTSGGGCIISHAPGTGKTLLTIVFIESFLKKFPRCCPVIVAPASMLLTWEAEFKKWQVGFSFVNLNNSELLIKKNSNSGGSRVTKDWIRTIKIHSWNNGGSVLGISYSLFEKLAGSTDTNNTNHKKMGNVLLDVSNLVVLDEGHTPRNQNSSIWNILLRLKTKNRVILSGTPFQNNFRELFNTLRLVRPETATKIVNEKAFADMISGNKKKCGDVSSSSTSNDIEKLKVIISPFVHVHNGRILEKKLPGLKQSVILLNPLPFQNGFIEKLKFGKPLKSFEYDYKEALVSIHPSLILCCSLSQTEEESTNREHLKYVRLHPDVGVKTKFVMELIRLSVASHEKVLIFSQFIPPLELLKDQIASVFGWDVKREIMLIKGRINQNLRRLIINDFNDPNSKVKVLLASTKCCSEGIHLTGASRVVLLDVVWNPSVERQAISRAYRLGQKKVVYTYHLMAAGTTEEGKYDRQVEKGRLAEMVFSSSRMAGKELKNKEKADVIELNDKILQQMVQHQELKEMFNKITYPENQTS